MTTHAEARVFSPQNSSRPPLSRLIAATVEALKNLGGSASNDEIHDEVVRLLHLSRQVVEQPHTDGRQTRLFYGLHWARTYLKKVGGAENTERGVWTLTPKGRSLTPEEIDAIVPIVRQMNREARRARKTGVDSEVEEEEEPGAWPDRLLAVLQSMAPDAFERLCQRVLRESGFVKVEVTGRTGDGGIDGNGVLRMNLVSFQVLFQAKRWQNAVGSSVVRDFRGAMIGRADKGLIITTGRFSTDARKEAARDGAPTIDLVDGNDLCLLLKNLGIGVKVRQVEEVDIDEAVFRSI
jgi:restriction system protein